MSTNFHNRRVEILAWAIFLSIVQVFRKLRDVPLHIYQELLQRFQLRAVGRSVLLSVFGLLLGLSAGYLIAWLIFDGGLIQR